MFNTIKESAGSLCLRQGNYNEAAYNIILANSYTCAGPNSTTVYAAGIRMYGQDHSVHDNYIEYAKGTVSQGAFKIDSGDVDTAGDIAGHWRNYRSVITSNVLYGCTEGLTVGGSGTYQPINLTLKGNVVQQSANNCFNIMGEVSNYWSEQLAWPTGTAVAGSSNGVVVLTPSINVSGFRGKALATTDVGPSAP